jgi:phage host-nuclease inhibitor protein Gam
MSDKVVIQTVSSLRTIAQLVARLSTELNDAHALLWEHGTDAMPLSERIRLMRADYRGDIRRLGDEVARLHSECEDAVTVATECGAEHILALEAEVARLQAELDEARMAWVLEDPEA